MGEVKKIFGKFFICVAKKFMDRSLLAVGGGCDSRPVIVHSRKPDNMVFAGFSASSWFFRGLRMHVRRTVAAGKGGTGGGIVSFFSHAASRDRLHVALH